MADWPNSLPSYVTINNFSNTLPNNTIRSQTDTGPPKTRRRATSAPEIINCGQTITGAQYATLRAFYVSTLLYGALPFNWSHPITGTTVVMKFTSPPTINSAGGGDWFDVNYQLEIMP